MRKVKKYYGKTSGNQLVHFVVCFNNEVNDIAIAKKYARKIAEYYKSRYQILYAIHHELRLTKSGYAKSWFHVHIVMNSVSFVDGKMFADNKKDIGRFMEHISEVTGDDWWRLRIELLEKNGNIITFTIADNDGDGLLYENAIGYLCCDKVGSRDYKAYSLPDHYVIKI